MLTLATLSAAAEELTVISFGRADQEALAAAYIQPFMQATGLSVRALSYDGQTTELSEMVNAGAPAWDVIQVESRTLEQGCRQGLFEKLDPARLPTASTLIPGTLSECGVGIFAWSHALVYSDQLARAPRNWSDFWDLAHYPGKRGLRRSARYTREIALLADGVPLDQVYPTLSTAAGVDRAFRKLEQIRDHTIWWEAAAQPAALLAAGTLTMSSGYSLWFDPSQARNRHTHIVWDASLYDVDSWAIPKGTPRRDAAYRFIYFSSQAEQQKVVSEHLPYGPTNRGALALLPATLRDALPSSNQNLGKALRIDTAFWIAHGDALERRFDAWAPAICRQQTDDDDDDYFDQPLCQDAQGTLRTSTGQTSARGIGQPGDPARVSRTVTLTMDDGMRFLPAQITARKGETLRLVLHNRGNVRHELVLGELEALRRHAALMQAMPDMQHSGPNMLSLAPGEDGELVWHFTRTGTFDFACLQKGHLEAGMSGRVSVE